jgi:hypothetical protein
MIMLAASCAWSALNRRDAILGLNRWHETIALVVFALVLELLFG